MARKTTSVKRASQRKPTKPFKTVRPRGRPRGPRYKVRMHKQPKPEKPTIKFLSLEVSPPTERERLVGPWLKVKRFMEAGRMEDVTAKLRASFEGLFKAKTRSTMITTGTRRKESPAGFDLVKKLYYTTPGPVMLPERKPKRERKGVEAIPTATGPRRHIIMPALSYYGVDFPVEPFESKDSLEDLYAEVRELEEYRGAKPIELRPGQTYGTYKKQLTKERERMRHGTVPAYKRFRPTEPRRFIDVEATRREKFRSRGLEPLPLWNPAQVAVLRFQEEAEWERRVRYGQAKFPREPQEPTLSQRRRRLPKGMRRG